MARKAPAPGKWKYQVEDLTALERMDRGLAIYTRVLVDGQYRDKTRLCDSIRDEDGKIIPTREAEAIAMAVERQQSSAAGVVDVRTGPVTLESGFRRMLHDRDGKYAGQTERKRDVERFSKKILPVLKGETRAADIRHAHYRKLWRHLAHEHAKDPKRYGPEAAVKIVGALRTLIAWLQEEELIEAGTGLPAANWKASMRAEWTQITSEPVRSPARPRYTPAENERLWRALPEADPRHRLMVQIGAELRLGQVPRTKRSDVQPYGGFRIGRVVVHGSGRKGGADPILTMEARHVLTQALTAGYLADIEAAYQRGEIEDFYLIPGGKLRTVKAKRGPVKRARVESAGRRWGRTGMRRAWQTLETLAKVPHVRWRNWYGMRRLSTDLAEDVESDDRVLNETSAHRDSATRRKYQEQGRSEVAERALTVRRKIRPKTKRDNNIPTEPKADR
jgi:hypothetical protein